MQNLAVVFPYDLTHKLSVFIYELIYQLDAIFIV